MKITQFDEVLELIPHLCRFEGCQVFVKTNDEHEKLCGYRQTDCKVDECNWEGCVTGLAEHLEKNHENKKKGSSNWYYPEVNPCKSNINIYCPILAYGQCFWMHTTNDYAENIFKIAFYCVPVGKIVNSFQITYTFNKDKKTHSTSILMLPENVRNEEENCICLPSSFVQTFVNSESELRFSFSIQKK